MALGFVKFQASVALRPGFGLILLPRGLVSPLRAVRLCPGLPPALQIGSK
jgi:hypothetical protein